MLSRLIRRLSGFCLVLACVTAAFAAEAFARTNAYGTQALVRLPGKRPGLMVAVNGYGPFRFLIDTATSHTVLTPQLRQRLALPVSPGPAYTVVTAAGTVRSHFHPVEEIAASGVIVEGIRAVVIDLPADLGVSGVLGADFLSNFTVDFDFKAQTIALYPEKTVLHLPGFQRLRGNLNSVGFIVAPARVENLMASGVFDSGAAFTVANPRLAAYTERTVRAIARNYENKVVDAARQRTWAHSYSFERISWGPASWRDRQIMVANMRVFGQIGLDGQPAIFIGMDLMAGRRIVMDYANASIWLAP